MGKEENLITRMYTRLKVLGDEGKGVLHHHKEVKHEER